MSREPTAAEAWADARLEAMVALGIAGFESWIEPLPWDSPIPLSDAEQKALQRLRYLVRRGLFGWPRPTV